MLEDFQAASGVLGARSRLIGVAPTSDMMLTGRVSDAAEEQAIGVSSYLVDEGAGAPAGIVLVSDNPHGMQQACLAHPQARRCPDAIHARFP